MSHQCERPRAARAERQDQIGKRVEERLGDGLHFLQHRRGEVGEERGSGTGLTFNILTAPSTVRRGSASHPRPSQKSAYAFKIFIGGHVGAVGLDQAMLNEEADGIAFAEQRIGAPDAVEYREEALTGGGS
ncbi:MAG TPA: hypothetical protein VFD27_06030 [Chthoniobacteraceae bacterium]|nr:hypothetical protein [Chthoniobacteraceae bacterium]